MSRLRAELSSWLERAKSGEEVVITERGAPVARLVAVDSTPLLVQLTESGVVGKPAARSAPTPVVPSGSKLAVRWPSW